MKTRLTLSIDEDLLREARAFAGQSGVCLSDLVADYLIRVTSERTAPMRALSPRLQRLLGSLRDGGVDEDAYRRFLEKQHSS